MGRGKQSMVYQVSKVKNRVAEALCDLGCKVMSYFDGC